MDLGKKHFSLRWELVVIEGREVVVVFVLFCFFVSAEAEGWGFISPLFPRDWAFRAPVRILPTAGRACSCTFSVLVAALTACPFQLEESHGLLRWSRVGLVSLCVCVSVWNSCSSQPGCPVFLLMSLLQLLSLVPVPLSIHSSTLPHRACFSYPRLSHFCVPSPCSVCLGTPPPLSAALASSQQHPSPVAAAPLAQGPALTVTHRADGGDFDEEASPPPVGA